jgi:anti-sigma B factor antagonist
MTGEVEGIRVMSLSGELDITRAPALRRELMEAVDNQDTGLVLDLKDATYMDSAAVNVLFEVAEGLTLRQVQLALVVPEGSLVERVVSLVDLGSVARLHPTLDAAVADVRSSS